MIEATEIWFICNGLDHKNEIFSQLAHNELLCSMNEERFRYAKYINLDTDRG